MNERIKELAVEADLLIKKSNGDEFRYGNFDPRFQKFAELIVRECTSVAGKYIHENKYTENGVSDFWLNETIKEHFGVE